MPLQGIRVLLVEDHDDSREVLGLSLASRGAVVREAASGEDALDAVASWTPDVVLMDLSLPDLDGHAVFARIREAPNCERLAGVVLSGRGRAADRSRSLAAGFTKHLVKPAAMADIITAITISLTPGSQQGVRSLLSQLNRVASCQFTSVFRFSERGTLVSLWNYDRAVPEVDAFPVDLAIEASYCVLVREAGQTVVIDDAARDDRAASHPKRTELAAYLGVPIFRPDGSLYGTLCSFDVAPQAFTDDARRAHEVAAQTLAQLLLES